MNTVIDRDERTVSVENASYRLAFLLLSFGVLVSAAYRSYQFQESSWDLLALVALTGGTAAAYQASQRVLSHRWATASLLAVIVAAVVALLVAWLR